ncbi:hypothetical protein M5D96_008415 [Drosophila gunungcola]|uniref:Secreted protein n=1 Tax=Drosophila gunungcola TaxID=103775 RepID=A0A9P9YK63_9MUSC|nr:hypothetical protein M5D96_008415 [Drosophila gunungcola]
MLMLRLLSFILSPPPTSRHFDGSCKRTKCHSSDIVRDQDHAPFLTVDSDSFSFASFALLRYSGTSTQRWFESRN